MCNLLQNPSFEVGLSAWVTNNVSLESRFAFEGTQSAVLNTGIASIYQDVTLAGTGSSPLLLSFSALSLFDRLLRPEGGNLVVEVIWLDDSGNPISTGLRMFLSSVMLVENDNRLTYVEVTNRPPDNAVRARLQFSKGELTDGDNAIIVDNVILAPIEDINLINNSNFEENLFGWNSINSVVSGFQQYEGTKSAVLNNVGLGTIYQDVPIDSLPANTSLLLSFAARRGNNGSNLSVKVDYRKGAVSLGRGLSLLIPANALNQTGWKTYALATKSAVPAGATIARVSFMGTDPNLSVLVDNVILTKVKKTNLILNPSFEPDLTNWIYENVEVTDSGGNYEGAYHARAGSSAFLFQDVNIGNDSGNCYLLTFAAQGLIESDALAKVIWLNDEGREIGTGTSLVIPELALYKQTPTGQNAFVWATFASVTEPSPPEATAARVLFSTSNNATLDIDLVSLTSIS